MASPRLGWASRSLMRAHREKPLGAGGGDGFAENSSAPGRSWAKAEFHTSPRPPKHGRGPESRLCPPGSPWDGSPWDGWHAEGHCLGRQLGEASAWRGLTRVRAMFPAAPSWSPPQNISPAQPRRCGRTRGQQERGWVLNHPARRSPLHVGQRSSKTWQASHPAGPAL